MPMIRTEYRTDKSAARLILQRLEAANAARFPLVDELVVIRKAAGLSQAAMAARAGLSPNVYAAIENRAAADGARLPSLEEAIDLIGAVLGLLDELEPDSDAKFDPKSDKAHPEGD